MSPWKSLLVLTFGILPALSFAKPEAKLLFFQNKTRVSSRGFKLSTKWNWQKNSEGVITLTPRLYLVGDKIKNFKRVRVGNRSTKVSLKNDRLVVQLAGLRETVQLVGSENPLTLKVQIVPTKTETLVQHPQCEDLEIRLTTEKPIPFYVGGHCQRKTNEDTIGFSLTFPREVDLETSTLFDVKGKGEPWRYYELKKVTSGQLGTFTLNYRGKSYLLTLASNKAETQVTARNLEKILFLIGAGLAMPGATGTGVNSTDTKPAILFQIPHYPVLGNFNLGIDGELGIPLGVNSNSVSYLRTELIANYKLKLGTSLRLFPLISYLFLSQVHDQSRVGISASQVVVGLNLEYDFTRAWIATLGFSMVPLASGSFGGYYALVFHAVYKHPDKTGFGLGFRLQGASGTTDIGNTVTTPQMGFYALLAF